MEEAPKTPAEENVLSDYYTGYQQLELASAESHIKKARNALFVIAALTLAVNLILLSNANALTGAPLAIVLALTAIYTALGFLTRKQPFGAIMIGLVIYVGLWIFDIAVLGIESLLRGVLFKGIIIYFLVSGLKHAREAERLKRELEKNL